MKHTQESLTTTQKLLWSSLSHQPSSTNGFLPPGGKYSVTDLVNEADEPLESKQQDVYCRVNKAGDKMKIIVWPTFISPHIHFMRKRNQCSCGHMWSALLHIRLQMFIYCWQNRSSITAPVYLSWRRSKQSARIISLRCRALKPPDSFIYRSIGSWKSPVWRVLE